MLKVASHPPDTPSKYPGSAERSPIVQSTNWKEHMLLQKELHILNRSEKNLVHRIAIDQKVLFRRFQMKLHRSKLAFAEMMREKETVMQLRGMHLHDLNTNCGQNEGDYTFLAKLEYRPCTAEGSSGTRPLPRPCPREHGKVSYDVNRQVIKEKHPTYVRSMSASCRYTSANGDKAKPDTGRRLAPSPPLSLRPATAAGTQIEKEYFFLPNLTDQTSVGRIQSRVAQMNRIGTHYISEKVSRGGQSQVGFANLPSNTFRYYPESNASSRKGTASAKQGRSSKKSKKGKWSIFEDVKKLNVLELFLNEARSIDHGSKVKEFCESMKEYENSGQDLDYYPQKMQAEVEHAKDDHLSIPGTPDSENYKFVGNTKVKSLTMPLLNLNFAEGMNLWQEDGQERDWGSYHPGPQEFLVEKVTEDIEPQIA